MVSKAVLCIFVALCCAQAFAAPYESDEVQTLGFEVESVRGTFGCMKELMHALHLINDAREIYKEFKVIFDNAKDQKKACESTATEEKTAEQIAACKKDASDQQRAALIAEARSLPQKLATDLPIIQKIVKKCLEV